MQLVVVLGHWDRNAGLAVVVASSFGRAWRESLEKYRKGSASESKIPVQITYAAG